MTSLYSIKAILILDQDGNRLFANYYDSVIFPSLKEQVNFEKRLFTKTHKVNSEIVLFDGVVCAYRTNVDLIFYVVGSAQENELLISNVLSCLYEALSIVLHKNVEKKALLEKIDIAFLIMDEICDDGIVLETDPHGIVNRCAVRPDDLAFGDQSISQVGISLLGSAKDQFKWSLLK